MVKESVELGGHKMYCLPLVAPPRQEVKEQVWGQVPVSLYRGNKRTTLSYEHFPTSVKFPCLLAVWRYPGRLSVSMTTFPPARSGFHNLVVQLGGVALFSG
jgi:hypothetical protein